MSEQTIDITKLELWELWKMVSEQQAMLFQAQRNLDMLQAEIARRAEKGA